jgi:hypothetical protein
LVRLYAKAIGEGVRKQSRDTESGVQVCIRSGICAFTYHQWDPETATCCDRQNISAGEKRNNYIGFRFSKELSKQKNFTE